MVSASLLALKTPSLFGKYFKYCSDYEQTICLGQIFSLSEVCIISNATTELYELNCYVVQDIDGFHCVPVFLKFNVLDLVYDGERFLFPLRRVGCACDWNVFGAHFTHIT
jgi:hypothetical protein